MEKKLPIKIEIIKGGESIFQKGDIVILPFDIATIYLNKNIGIIVNENESINRKKKIKDNDINNE